MTTHGFSSIQMFEAFYSEFWNLIVSMIPNNWPLYALGSIGVFWFISKFFKIILIAFVCAFAYAWWIRGGMIVR